MAWRDDMAGTASFRGVPFKTTDAELGIGRRGVLNQYPLRDEPYFDDLGRRARRYRVDGFIVGPDYLAQRDALIEALETKGPGELVHPRYGTVWVSLPEEVPIRESHAEGGMARFTAVFVEDTDNRQPSAEADTASDVESTTAAADDAAQVAFVDETDVSGPEVLSDLMGNAVTDDVDALTGIASLFSDSSGLGEILTAAAGVIANVFDLVRTPVKLATSLRGLHMSLAVSTRADISPSGILSSLGAFTVAQRASIPSAPVEGAVSNPSLRGTLSRTVVNDAARGALQRRLSITTQARVLAIAITDQTVTTAQQAVAWRDQVVEQIDAELELADPDVNTALALARVRAAVVRDVAERAELLKQRSTFTSVAVLPALVLAHRIYQDADRADELVERNDVRHPAFVPARALEILL